MDHLKPQATKAPRQVKPKVFVANGSNIPLKGKCLLFIKTGEANSVISDQNMVKVRAFVSQSERGPL